mgnify:CR=1 FL=1
MFGHTRYAEHDTRTDEDAKSSAFRLGSKVCWPILDDRRGGSHAWLPSRSVVLYYNEVGFMATQSTDSLFRRCRKDTNRIWNRVRFSLDGRPYPA